MSKTIKTITTLKKHVGDTVHVVSYDGYEFDATIVNNLRYDHTGLFTTDKKASEDTYWWPSDLGYGHITEKPYQLKEELKSVELVEAKETERKEDTAKTFLSALELIANEGHYCEMADGSTGYIAGSKYPDHVCVLHNSEGPSEGWIISRYDRTSEIKGVYKSFIKKFSKGWHVCSDDDAEQVKVVKILDEAIKPKSVKASKPKKAKQNTITLKDIKENFGHGCTFKSGDKGYICEGTYGHTLICFNTKQNDHGWLVDRDVPENMRKHFKYAYYIIGDDNVKDLGVVSIDPETTDFKPDEFKKSFLTREQLLENIGKRCEISDGTEGLIVKTDMGNPRILMHTRVNGHGWLYSEEFGNDTGATSSVKSKYAFGWNVCDDSDAEDISVVKVLDDDKCAESSKTILDMTIREVLEKLNEIIISR